MPPRSSSASGLATTSDAPSADQIRDFADRVDVQLERVSRGSSPSSRSPPATPASRLRWPVRSGSGDLDLAVVASRAWDTVGVPTLAPLNAPFLVTTDELVAEIVTSDLSAELMAGLTGAGVAGLALLPEGLRHPFGFGEPIRSAADFDGQLMRAPWSRTSAAMFAALGARTTADDVDPATQRGAESSYRLTPAGVATGNIVFYPKINVLVANADLRDELTEAQWSALEQAAIGTRDWVVDDLPVRRSRGADVLHPRPGEIVAATDRQVADLQRRTAVVVDQLRDDPVTGPLVQQIEELAAGVDETDVAHPVSGCPGATMRCRSSTASTR